jgi:hypothetical protein
MALRDRWKPEQIAAIVAAAAATVAAVIEVLQYIH